MSWGAAERGTPPSVAAVSPPPPPQALSKETKMAENTIAGVSRGEYFELENCMLNY